VRTDVAPCPSEDVAESLVEASPRFICIFCEIGQKSKNVLDWPLKRPMSVKNLTTPLAMPFVSVGRMIEHGGSLRLRKGHGSGMIKFAFRLSPAIVRSGKVTDTPVTGSTAVSGVALPALSCQV
jgi:hypothetical protein